MLVKKQKSGKELVAQDLVLVLAMRDPCIVTHEVLEPPCPPWPERSLWFQKARLEGARGDVGAQDPPPSLGPEHKSSLTASSPTSGCA